MGHDHGGMTMMPAEAPTTARVLGLDLASASPVAWVAVAMLVVYLLGLLQLRRRGVHWSGVRTLSWVAGCLSVFYVTASGLQSYGMALFSIHMVQHMALSMASPLLLLLGAPVTLALRTLPVRPGLTGAPRRVLLWGLHSKVGRFIAHPGFTIPLFVASLYGIYLTPLFDDLMSSHIGHTLMLAHFLITGMLFFGPIMAIDPWPRRTGHAGRMIELLLPTPFHAFFGVAIMMSSTLTLRTFANPPAAWGVDPLFDQGVAGGIAWSFGELPTVLVLAVVFFQWARSEERTAKSVQRSRDRAVARGEADTDPELDAYNERLRRLAATRP